MMMMAGRLGGKVDAYNNGLGRTPIMGWNSWCTDSLCNAFGKDPCSEEMVFSTVDAIVSQGLDKLGYTWIDLDDCWSSKNRSAEGELMADPKNFPNGMKHVADYVHAHNLSFGLYTCIGKVTCKGDRPGSFGHYEQDAKTLTSWGVDKVKVDHCTAPNISDRDLYGNFSRAFNATGRPVLFALCNWGGQDVSEWGVCEFSVLFYFHSAHLFLFLSIG